MLPVGSPALAHASDYVRGVEAQRRQLPEVPHREQAHFKAWGDFKVSGGVVADSQTSAVNCAAGTGDPSAICDCALVASRAFRKARVA